MQTLNKLVSAGCVVSFLAAPPSMAQEPTVIEMNSIQALRFSCRQPERSVGYSVCLGFVAGMSQSMQLNGRTLDHISTTDTAAVEYLADTSLCAAETPFPTEITGVQAFLSWADRNPDKWNSNVSVGVTRALVETWPCQNLPHHP
jgi:hypothetical protein